MKDAINVKWTGDMAFEAVVDEHRIVMDAKPEVGGKNSGPRPKPLLMVSLAGCTGMDVISILRKMKVEVTGFYMRVIAELTEDHPKRYTAIKLIYEFSGINLPADKLQRAVELSQEKYCGVSATLKDSCEISYEIKINEI
ncbi:MAG: OsmC family protein [Bacteroidales bacterium]|nr:OsmC family protein [Bacteroidales bacterium]